MITENQFEVLTYIERNKEQKIPQRKLAKHIEVSVGTVNKVISDLMEMELIKESGKSLYEVTLKGYETLEPFRVRRAVFLAAGFGSRLVPITLNTPKPLVMVKEKKIIETLLDAVIAAGIQDIYIVRGYLKQQFDLLLDKYPMIKFIDNPLYNESNNISSAYYARHLFENAYVLESDLLLSNPQLIRKYEYHSNYLGIKKERTDDWCFETNGHVIKSIAVGGVDCYQLVGISYWDQNDGLKMNDDIEYVFKSPGGKEKYWDVIALDVCKKNHTLHVRPCLQEDIIEIDTFNELKEIDPIYKS